MGLNDTPSGERLHIGFFGCRNAGKSSLINAFTGQKLAVVSDVPGTTTDPVKKAMELLPLGPVMLIDTPGYDDEGELGEKRVQATKDVLRRCDIAILVTDCTRSKNETEEALTELFKKRNIPYFEVRNKCDLLEEKPKSEENVIFVSAKENTGITELKNAVAKVKRPEERKKIAGDLVKRGDFAVLVVPIDSAAPKGRLILPQQQTIRDILDAGAVAVTVKEDALEETLKSLGKKPAIVITDSQVFKFVSEVVPQDIPLTSFSILMARHKGFLETAVKGARKLDEIKDGSKILISEGCTHHRQCEDIGTVKLPRLIRKYTNSEPSFSFTSGGEFPEDIEKFDLIIHCGGCMLTPAEMGYRMQQAVNSGIPFTNYGTAIAHMNSILERSISVLPEFR